VSGRVEGPKWSVRDEFALYFAQRGAEQRNFLAPARKRRCIQVEEIENAADGLVDDVVDGLRPGVEGGDWRRDDASHLGHREHAAQRPRVKGKFAHQKNEPASLLERDVGCPCQQAVSYPGGDLAQRVVSSTPRCSP